MMTRLDLQASGTSETTADGQEATRVLREQRDRLQALYQDVAEALAVAGRERDAAQVALAVMRELLERTAYVHTGRGLTCRYCHSSDSGLVPRGRDTYEVHHRQSCPLSAPSPERGAALLAAADRMAKIIEKRRLEPCDDGCQQNECESARAAADWRAQQSASDARRGGEEG